MRVSWQLFLGNAVVLTIAIAVLSLSPLTVSHPVSAVELAELIVGLAVLFAINSLIIRTSMRPLRELEQAIERVGAPDRSLQVLVRRGDEVGAVALAFNEMMQRLDHERANTTRAVIEAQEEERGRVAAELHDEVGQSLTVLLLRLKLLRDQAPEGMQEGLAELADAIRATLSEVRGLAARLRPGALDDLGLVSAVKGLQEVAGEASGLRIGVEADLGEDLSRDQELVVYRVAQEALTNVLRHAQATRASVRLHAVGGQVRLSVTDNGVGWGPAEADRRGFAEGTGMSGMRERARLVGGRFTVTSEPGSGTAVELAFPIGPGTGSDTTQRTNA